MVGRVGDARPRSAAGRSSPSPGRPAGSPADARARRRRCRPRSAAAPIVPATCVPWPFSSTSAGSSQDPSGSAAQAPSMSGMSTVKLRLSVGVDVGRRGRDATAVDAGVDHADQHVGAARLVGVGAGRRWRRSSPCPTAASQRLGRVRRRDRPLDPRTPGPSSTACRRCSRSRDTPIARFSATPAIAGRAPTRAAKRRAPPTTVARPTARFSDDLPARRADGRARLRRRGALLVEHHVRALAGRRRRRRGARGARGQAAAQHRGRRGDRSRSRHPYLRIRPSAALTAAAAVNSRLNRSMPGRGRFDATRGPCERVAARRGLISSRARAAPSAREHA